MLFSSSSFLIFFFAFNRPKCRSTDFHSEFDAGSFFFDFFFLNTHAATFNFASVSFLFLFFFISFFHRIAINWSLIAASHEYLLFDTDIDCVNESNTRFIHISSFDR